MDPRMGTLPLKATFIWPVQVPASWGEGAWKGCDCQAAWERSPG